MQSEMMVVDALQISGLHVRLEFLTLPHLLSTNTKTNIEYFERRLASVSGSNVWSTLLHITTHYYTLLHINYKKFGAKAERVVLGNVSCNLHANLTPI